ncbi:MAG: superoxide dismutase [Thermaceae bacterium]|nr:superoxide dismutase [Thermaceae bacterium]
MSYPFKLPDLGYDKAALEPSIDAQTMEIHHDKHHAAYVNNLNAALEKAPEVQGWSLEELLQKINQVPEAIRTAVRNNGGGHHNHTLLWDILTPGGSKTPTGRLAEAINTTFGSFDEFKKQMTQAGATRFGSGWAWLVKDKSGGLKIYSTANQDSPLMEGDTPLLGIDVWEHAYYLKYQNRRPDYLAAIWDVINWDKVGQRF